MPRRARLAARYDEHPLCDVSERGPDLLPVHVPATIVGQPCGGGHRCQIRPRARLGVSLRPELGDVDDAGEEALLLFLGAELDQRRAEKFLSEVIHPRRRIRTRILLMKDDSLLECRAPAPVPRGPPEACPPRRREVPVPCQTLGEELVLTPRTAPALEEGELADEILREPLANGPGELKRGVRGTSSPFTQVNGPIGEVDRRHGR